ncbi:unnamed protein product [Cuscuta epithymum]|uniref:RNase H type-1 domain-containing protein n=1 Tax=Cuscuta epithymum TaxID=186058 RepID=A0AAV0EQH7_9ASTE|nr:unnamed protein product [Cuscuta epithymum]
MEETKKKKYKLNVDAAYLRGISQGGAILRNNNGELIWAVAFHLCSKSSEEAEVRALVQATEMAMAEGFVDVQVETDAMRSLTLLQNEIGNHGGLTDFRQEALGRSYTFEHVLREGNGPAHSLAAHPVGQALCVRFDQVGSLPNQVKMNYYADLFGIPRFRL